MRTAPAGARSPGCTRPGVGQLACGGLQRRIRVVQLLQCRVGAMVDPKSHEARPFVNRHLRHRHVDCDLAPLVEISEVRIKGRHHAATRYAGVFVVRHGRAVADELLRDELPQISLCPHKIAAWRMYELIQHIICLAQQLRRRRTTFCMRAEVTGIWREG